MVKKLKRPRTRSVIYASIAAPEASPVHFNEAVRGGGARGTVNPDLPQCPLFGRYQVPKRTVIPVAGGNRSKQNRRHMYKLIAIAVAVIPIVLFLRSVFFRRSRVMKQASSDLRRRIDYLVWAILFLVVCVIVYSVVRLIYPFWK